jgi:ATP-dependent helicase/nuclease subunit B
MVHLIVAPAGRGKTAYVIDAVRALPPLSSARILVPDHVEAASFRRRLAQAGGALGVAVQTFYDLYADVLTLAVWPSPSPAASSDPPSAGSLPLSQELGEGKGWGGGEGLARLPPTVRHRLVERLVEILCDAGQLDYYAPLRGSSGFAHLLGELFGELKRARVFPEELERVLAAPPQSPPRAGGMSRRYWGGLIELARLYTAYQSWLLETGWVDADGQGWLASIALEQNPSLLSDLVLLAVDGFDEFNPTQLHVLRLLAGRAETTIVTLTGEPLNPNRLAHRRFARAHAALVEALGVEPVSLPLISSSPPPLVHLEQNLFDPNAASISADDTVVFLEAQDRATEAREALRWLKARVVRDGVSTSDGAIIARDVLPYRPFLEDAAAEFGIPLRFVSGSGLRTNPAVSALLSLLTLPVEPLDWSPQALLDVLTSPYFDWTGRGLGPDDPGRLLDVARAGQVVGGLDQWREAFRASGSASRGMSEDENDGVAPRHPPVGAELARLSEAFEEVVARITPMPQATLREYVRWIENLVGEDPALAERNPVSARNRVSEGDASLHIVVRARENPATAERDVAALRALKDILRGLVLADAVLVGQDADRCAASALSYGSLVAGLVQAVQDATYTISVEDEAILVASALEARGLTFDSVALLGLAEGEFPRAEREDALLCESDRAWLAEQGFAIGPRLRGDEVTFFYQAVTRAHQRLLLCRPYLADDGQPWEPSPYWPAVQRLFESATVRHVRPADPAGDPASEQERIAAASDTSVAVLRARAQAVPSPWTGDLSALQALLTERFGADVPWSSSRLETYARCPFYFWAAYAMELEPRELPRAGFDVLMLGSIYHLVLERLYARVSDGDPDWLQAELSAVAQEVYDAAPHDYGFRPTPLWEREQEELTETLRRTVEALIEAAGEYAPLVQELPFGLHEHPPLVLRGQGQALPLQMRGYIDRVDRAPDGRLRVIDYKAGSTPITPRDLEEGHRLQLPLYALAAEQALGAQVASGFYWHIGAAKPSSLKLEKYEGGVVGAVDAAVEYALSIGAAVCDGQFAPKPPDEGCPAFCPAVAFCERYKPRLW